MYKTWETRKKVCLILAYLLCVSLDKLEKIATALLIAALFLGPFLCIFVLPSIPCFKKW